MPKANASTVEINGDNVAEAPEDRYMKDVETRIASVEGQIGAMATDPRIGSALMRVAELEKKVSNGTSDPILDEVAHRLAALESQQEKPDKAHTEKLASRLDEIERRISGISPVDPRTDDLVIRTASLEAAKNTAPPDQLQEALQRVRQVEAAVGRFDNDQFAKVPSRLAELENGAAQEASDPRVDTLITRVFDLEEQLQTSPAASQLEALAERVEFFQTRAGHWVQDEQLAQVVSRIHSLEETAEAVPHDPRIDRVAERLEDLEQRSDGAETESRLGEVGTRLSLVEAKVEQPADDPRWEELGERWAALDERLQNQDAESRISALNDRLTDAESRAAETPEPDLGPLLQRLDELEAAVSESSGDPRVDELAGRLGSLESSGPSVDARLDEVLHRTSVLEEHEELGGEPVDTTALEKRLSALEAEPAGEPSAALVDQLAERLEGLESSGHGADPRLDEVLYRISVLEEQNGLGGEPVDTTAIEKRLGALEAEPAGGSSRALVDQLTERLESLESSGSGADPRLDEVLLRISALEEQEGLGGELVDTTAIEKRLSALEAEPAGDLSPALVDQLTERLESLESSGPSTDPRLDEVLLRISALEEQEGLGGEPVDTTAIEKRLGALEAEPAGGPSPALVDQLTERLEAIEKGHVETPPDSAVDDLTRRIAAIEEKAERPTGDAGLDDSRLDEVFARLSDMEDGSREPVSDPRVAELSSISFQ